MTITRDQVCRELEIAIRRALDKEPGTLTGVTSVYDGERRTIQVTATLVKHIYVDVPEVEVE